MSSSKYGVNESMESGSPKFQKIQLFINSHSRAILLALFIVANVILIGFSCAVIGLLNNGKDKCNVTVRLVSLENHTDFTEIPDYFLMNMNGAVFFYERYYNASVPFKYFPDGQKNFWSILDAIFICILATSFITLVTLCLYVIVQSATSDNNGNSNNKLGQRVASAVARHPPVIGMSRLAAFIGAILQILLFCCMTAVLMAAILQADFEDNFENMAAYGVNMTLGGVLPAIVTDELEAYDQEISGACWTDVYVWIDGDPVVRFGVILLAVSTFELMSIFACAALMKRSTVNSDEYDQLTTGVENFQHDNLAMEADDDSSKPRYSSKDIEMKGRHAGDSTA